jgi:hypothetical protein
VQGAKCTSSKSRIGLLRRHSKQRETLAASIARFDREEAVYFQARAADNSALAVYALGAGAPAETTARLQRAAAFFAGEARRSLTRLLEG